MRPTFRDALLQTLARTQTWFDQLTVEHRSLKRRYASALAEISDLQDEYDDQDYPCSDCRDNEAKLLAVDGLFHHLDRIRDLQVGAIISPQVTLEAELAAMLEIRRAVEP